MQLDIHISQVFGGLSVALACTGPYVKAAHHKSTYALCGCFKKWPN